MVLNHLSSCGQLSTPLGAILAQYKSRARLIKWELPLKMAPRPTPARNLDSPSDAAQTSLARRWRSQLQYVLASSPSQTSSLGKQTAILVEILEREPRLTATTMWAEEKDRKVVNYLTFF